MICEAKGNEKIVQLNKKIVRNLASGTTFVRFFHSFRLSCYTMWQKSRYFATVSCNAGFN